MAIAAGSRLGPYEVVALIGAGGMGEVYRAHDTRLNRDVALKVLPEAFARDAQRMARFEREAKLLAALNHPNIAAIYGLEESGPIRALVMELVEGPTLAERIRGGPVPVDEALPTARQVADAVEYAHDNNVIHRDLKPANIKVKADGMVKVLDFGLAKALSDEPTAEDMSNSPTLSMAATMQGVILGTAAYMAPEQAKGKRVDRRADIWAFGVVLYEMLTGKPLFSGETVAETLASVMMKEPAFAALPSNTPQPIRNVLRRCLERNPKRRLQHAGEARILIEDVLSGAAPAEPVAARGVRSLGRRAILVGAGCLVAACVVTGLAVWSLRPAPPPQPVSRVIIPLPANDQLRGIAAPMLSLFRGVAAPMLSLSPDGTQLAYVAGTGGPIQGQIYLRALDSLEARPLAGTEGNPVNPFFSPDGQWIGFFADGKLKKVSVSGGAVLTLCDASGPRGAAWGANDTIVFAPTPAGGLSQVSAAGGDPQVLTKLNQGEGGHRWPQFLPDGKAILYTIGAAGGANYDNAHIAVRRLDTGEQRVLVRGGTYARYAPTGHLVYYRAGTIMAVPFDTARLEVLGTPAPVVEGVMPSGGTTGAGQFSFSSRGSLVYVPGEPGAGAERTLVWVDRKGVESPLPAPPRVYDDPRISPDGQQVALQVAGAVWIYDIPRGTSTRLTFEGSADVPVWTPDGKRITFLLTKPGAGGLFWKPADGSGPEEPLMSSELVPESSSVSPDGQTLAFSEGRPGTGNRDISVIPLQGERKPKPFLQTPFQEVAPMFSPDGRWLAYVSNESGRLEVYVQPYPGPGRKWLISTEGGADPVWSRNGRELFYRNGDKMMAVDIATQPAFRAGTPRMLFERPGYVLGVRRADYDVSPDGRRFLMLKEDEQEETALTQINVVLNWFEELKRRVPTR